MEEFDKLFRNFFQKMNELGLQFYMEPHNISIIIALVEGETEVIIDLLKIVFNNLS